jgi:hypothetical protein
MILHSDIIGDAMNQDPISQLRRMVCQFEQLDKNLAYLCGHFEGDVNRFAVELSNTLMKVLDAKTEIKRYLADMLDVKIGDRRLADKLRKIRDNKGYFVDKLCQGMSQEFDPDFDWMDALWTNGTADYVNQNFFKRRDEVGAIIVQQGLNDRFRSHLENIRDAYALGQYEAAIVFCRALIEVGVFEILTRKGVIRAVPGVTDIDAYRPRELMQKVKPYVRPQSLHQETIEVVKRANSLLHSKNPMSITSEKDALESIKTTFRFLEALYS